MEEQKTKCEGFWRTKEAETSPLPFPIANELSDAEAANIAEKLQTIEQKILAKYKTVKKPYPANTDREEDKFLLIWLGKSQCRICGKKNGNLTYRHPSFEWPDGLLHYIKDHKVKPSKEFIDFLDGETK